MSDSSLPVPDAPTARAQPSRTRPRIWSRVLRHSGVRIGTVILLVLIIIAVFAPWLGTMDPTELDPGSTNLDPGTRQVFNSLSGDSFEHFFLMGSDALGRDLWSRIAYGTRFSLAIASCVAVFSLIGGLIFGLLAGYSRRLDPIIMRVMDGMMAIPSILFAITLVAVLRASLVTIIIAIVVPEIPRVARLVRSVVLGLREEPFIEASISLGSSSWKVIVKHILPNSVAPLLIQGTYICGAAMLTEAILSFLGVGMPEEVPTWGNIMAEGRSMFTLHPANVLLPGAFLCITILAVNLLGDGLRDTLDPKFNKRS